uniref:Uncharacterized protein n=1 Tax=Anguilla anguilla TaxID=7936 RepID=A0A0E9UK46_ANGAN
MGIKSLSVLVTILAQ